MSSRRHKLYALDAVYDRHMLLVGLVAREATPDGRRTPYVGEHGLHVATIAHMTRAKEAVGHGNRWRELMHERGRW